jgi:uncharacterized membrane protein YtjA (UPF0391 family)
LVRRAAGRAGDSRHASARARRGDGSSDALKSFETRLASGHARSAFYFPYIATNGQSFIRTQTARGTNLACTSATKLKLGLAMLKLAILFAVISVLAGLFGFTRVSSGAAGIAKICFVIFLILFVVFLVMAITAGSLVL